MRRASSVILFSLALAGMAVPVASDAQVICTGNASPPPELPVYEQPPIPGAKSATNPTGGKRLEERGMGTGPSGTNPGGARSVTNPTGGMSPGPNPGGVGTSNPRGMGGDRATLNGGNAPRMPNTGTPPLQPMPHAGGPPPQAGQLQKNKDNKDKDH